jgi:hypothetical protein
MNLWLARPFYNWDLLGYMGVAIAYTENTPEAIHAQTYSMAQTYIPQADYHQLTTLNSFQSAVAKEPQYFIQQLPFYSVKPLYPSLMFLMQGFGVNLVAASVLIVRTAYLGIGLLLFLWASAGLRPLLAFVVTSFMASVSYVVDLARYSTPDALSTLVILTVFALLIKQGGIHSALSLLTISIAIRPDNLLLLLSIALYIVIFDRHRRRWALGYSVLGIALYLAEVIWSGNYGWTTLFYHLFVEYMSAPAGFISPLTFSEYLKIYVLRVHPRFEGSSVILFALLNVLAIVMYYRQFGRRSRWLHLLIVNGLFMLAHWLVFPGEKERQLVASYLLILMALTNATNFLNREGAGEKLTN